MCLTSTCKYLCKSLFLPCRCPNRHPKPNHFAYAYSNMVSYDLTYDGTFYKSTYDLTYDLANQDTYDLTNQGTYDLTNIVAHLGSYRQSANYEPNKVTYCDPYDLRRDFTLPTELFTRRAKPPLYSTMQSKLRASSSFFVPWRSNWIFPIKYQSK